MKIFDVLKSAENTLRISKVPNPRLDAEYLLCDLIACERSDLLLKLNEELNLDILTKYEEHLSKRRLRIPLQHIIGFQNFYGFNFIVNSDVLIPRPETELLCEEAIRLIADKPLKILDLCTGSGVIATVISKYCKNAEVFASDISKKSIDIAMKNADKNNAMINFLIGNLYEPIKDLEFDVIISNPPYIRSNDCLYLQEEVLHDPILALDGGEHGLFFLENIIKHAPSYLKKDGFIMMEIGHDQGEQVQCLLSNDFMNIRVFKDLLDKDRFIYAKLK